MKPTPPEAAESFEYWPAKRVMEVVGYSRVTLWRKSRDPNDDFPAPYQIGPNKVAWRSDQIERWQRTRPPVTYAPGQEANAA